MAKQYIDVLIDGKVYSLGGSETEGYVQQIATYLNGKIFQLKAQPGFLKMPEDKAGYCISGRSDAGNGWNFGYGAHQDKSRLFS